MYRVSAWRRVVCLFAVLGACDLAPAAAARQPREDTRWTVQLVTSGGFVGLDRQIDVASTGRTTVVDRRANKKVERTASAAELVTLTRAIGKLAEVTPAPKESLCRDCIKYAVTVTAGKTTVSLNLDDTNLGSSSLAPIVQALVAMQHRALADIREP